VYHAVQNNDVSVNGKLSKCLRDTGCSSNVIGNKSLVDAEQYVLDHLI